MRLKAAYIGPRYHVRTRSTQFIIDLLQPTFDLTIIDFEYDGTLASELLQSVDGFDIVILLQVDFLAPVFLAAGIRTVVMPMFDASEHMPTSHWEISNQARFVSFSRQIHANLNRAGNRSLLVKYFPETKEPIRKSRRGTLDGFFWERRPDQGIDLNLIGKLAGANLSSLHVHRAPDIKRERSAQIGSGLGQVKITESEWFDDKEELTKIMSRCNVYFAPRMSEGIGMGFLEAMAYGMLVFAHDSSTHNEYICNWINGVLFSVSLENGPHLTADIAYDLGSSAQETVADGRRAWERQIPELIDWIATTPRPEVTGVELPGNELCKAYGAGFGSYVEYLRRNGHLVKRLSPSLADGRSNKISTIFTRIRSDDRSRVIEGAEMSFGDGGARRFLVDGWSHDEPDHVWIEGTKATLKFVMAEGSTFDGVVMRVFGVPGLPQRLVIVLNDQYSGSVDLNENVQEFYVPFPAVLVDDTVEVVFYAERTVVAPNDPRNLSVAVQSIRFS